MLSQKIVTPAKAGGQQTFNLLKNLLDSGFLRNDVILYSEIFLRVLHY